MIVATNGFHRLFIERESIATSGVFFLFENIFKKVFDNIFQMDLYYNRSIGTKEKRFMKIKEIFEKLNTINTLSAQLNNCHPFQIEFIVDENSVFENRKFTSFDDFKGAIEYRYISEFLKALMDVEFEESCYVNTLIATINFVVQETSYVRVIGLIIDR